MTDRTELQRRAKIRNRAPQTIPGGFWVDMVCSPRGGREMIRHLNDTVGMAGYELIVHHPVDGERVRVEVYVPGRLLALMTKLRWCGA